MAFSVPAPYFEKSHLPMPAKARIFGKSPRQNSPELFCSKCLKKGEVHEAFGFCKVCRDFLCSLCVRNHESSMMTLNHGLIEGDEMLTRYRHAMRKDKKRQSPDTFRGSQPGSRLSMVSNDRASIHYLSSVSRQSNRNSVNMGESKSVSLIRDINVRLTNEMQRPFICSSVILDGGNMILADANNRNLKFFNKHFNLMATFNMKREPWDCCTSMDKNSEFFVTESQVKGVHLFRISREINYLLTINVDGDCYGIAPWRLGVAASVKKNRKFSVQLLDQFGNIHKKITSGLYKELKLMSPWYLTSSSHGQTIIISDSERGTVTSLEVDGGIRFVYSNRKEFHDPRNVTTDQYGNIFVIDYETDSVHQISGSGVSLGEVLSQKDGLENPCGLTYNDGFLYLQNKMDTNKFQIYDLV